ncbi:MAG: AI-2E family transporter [Candidatus Schekmanbacteria bacterium]|nr:AI-2E family transporter [Candidatus Schekmanbacteria bacterium]
MNDRLIVPIKYPQKFLLRDLSLIIAFFILVITGIYYLRKPLIPFFVASVFSYIVLPLVDGIERLGINRIIATALVFAILGSIIIGSMLNFGPLLLNQIEDIKIKLPDYKVELQQEEKKIEDRVQSLQYYIQRQLPFLGNLHLLENVIPTVLSYLSSSIMDLPAVSTMFGLISIIVFVPFISFFLVLESRSIKKYLISLVPNRYFEVSVNFLYRINKQTEAYLGGVITEAIIVGILSAIGLYVLGINYFLFIAFIAAIFNVVPYLGPLSGALLAIVITLLDKGSFSTALRVIALFILIRLIDDLIVIPTVMSRTVKTHPVTVLLVILIGEYLLGIVGMVIAVPFFQVLKLIVKEIQGIVNRYALA